jgi:hypothetical protein
MGVHEHEQVTMEDILKYMIFEEEVLDYEFWENASHWMM